MDHVLEYASRVLVFKDGCLENDSTPLKLFKDINLVKKLQLDVPSVVELVNKLAVKYPKLLNYDIKCIDDFIKAYKDVISL